MTGGFPAGTRILMADNSTKAIEDLAAGDPVMSLLVDAHIMESARVVEIGQTNREGLFSINGGVLTVADGQPILIQMPDTRRGARRSPYAGTISFSSGDESMFAVSKARWMVRTPIRGSKLRTLRRLKRERLHTLMPLMPSEAAPSRTRWPARWSRGPGDLRDYGFAVSPHELSRACGYRFANDGVDTHTLQAYLGHANIQNTVRYTKLSTGRFNGLWKD